MSQTDNARFFSGHQTEVTRARLAKRRFGGVDVDVSDVKVYNLLILNLLTTIKKKIFNRPCVMVPQVDEPFSRKSWPGPP